MDKYNYNVEEMNQGTVTMVVDLAKAFETVQIKVVWAWATHFWVPAEKSSSTVLVLSASTKGTFRRKKCRSAADSHSHRSWPAMVSSAHEKT